MKKILIYLVLGVASLLLLPTFAAPFDLEPVDITNKDVEDSLHKTRWTEFCGGWTQCVLCILSNDTIINYELKESDVSAKLINYKSKDELTISYDSKTAKEQEVYIEVEYRKTSEGLETCYYHTRTEYTKDLVIDIIPIVLGFHQEQWATWSPTTLTWIDPVDGDNLGSGVEDIDIDANDSSLCNISWRWENSTHIGDWEDTFGNWSAGDEITCSGVNCDCVNPIYYYENIAIPSVYGNWVMENAATASDGKSINNWGPPSYAKISWNNFPYPNGTVCDVYLKNTGYLCAGAYKFFQNVNFSFNNLTWWNFTITGDSVCGENYYTGQTLPFNSSFDLNFAPINAAASAGFDNFLLDCGSEYYDGSWDTSVMKEGFYGLRILAVNGTGDINITEVINVTIDTAVPSACDIIYPPDFDDVCGDSDQCGYINLNPVVNVSAVDAGTGIEFVDITWIGTVSTLGNNSCILDDNYYWNNSAVVNDDYTVCAFCIDYAGQINSSCTTASVKWYGLDEGQNTTLYDLENCDVDYINTTVDLIWSYILQNYNLLNATQTSVTSVTVESESGFVNTTYFNVHENHIFAGEDPELDGSMWRYDQLKHNLYIDVPANISNAEVCARMMLVGNPADPQYTVTLNNKTLGTGTAANTTWHWDCFPVEPANVTTSMEFIFISNASWNVVNHYVLGVDQHGAGGYSHTSEDDGATWDEYPDGEFVVYLRVENYVVGLGETVWTYGDGDPDNNRTVDNAGLTDEQNDWLEDIYESLDDLVAVIVSLAITLAFIYLGTQTPNPIFQMFFILIGILLGTLTVGIIDTIYTDDLISTFYIGMVWTWRVAIMVTFVVFLRQVLKIFAGVVPRLKNWWTGGNRKL
jgi:hypothetical protein